MNHLKNYKSFKESISGTEIFSKDFGPVYGEEDIPNTISKNNTEVIYSDLTDHIYTKDEYDNLYQEYLTKGGPPRADGFNDKNLEYVITFLS